MYLLYSLISFNIMYNEKDDQIFIKLDGNENPTEFLLTKQPLLMLRANFVTKDQLRETVEIGIQIESEKYIRIFELEHLDLAMAVEVRIDVILRIVENVEAIIF